jgi:hypothetical protein
VSVDSRFTLLYVAIAVVVFVAGFAANFEMRAHYSVTTRTVKVERSWGEPSQSVPGGQVNQALTGLTCDVYGARKTVVCHP